MTENVSVAQMTQEERDQLMLRTALEFVKTGQVKEPDVIIAIGYMTGLIHRLQEEIKTLRERDLIEHDQ